MFVSVRMSTLNTKNLVDDEVKTFLLYTYTYSNSVPNTIL